MDNQPIIKNPFGLNIALPQKTIQEIQKVAEQEIENLTVNPFVDFLADNDDVFSGKVAEEIKKYNAQLYTLGQVMRAGQPITTFSAEM
ncbi:hypothetical protein IJD44_00405 [bacterium]|nr:hypothetical protein [bacterium]